MPRKPGTSGRGANYRGVARQTEKAREAVPRSGSVKRVQLEHRDGARGESVSWGLAHALEEGAQHVTELIPHAS
jgi:hypothetical protein